MDRSKRVGQIQLAGMGHAVDLVEAGLAHVDAAGAAPGPLGIEFNAVVQHDVAGRVVLRTHGRHENTVFELDLLLAHIEGLKQMGVILVCHSDILPFLS